MSKTQPRLGRGLSSLITSTQPAPAATPFATHHPEAHAGHAGPVFRDIPLDRIKQNPNQPRRVFDESKLAALARSLKTDGLLQPIVVRPDGDRYELVAGERRWRAAQLAELKVIPAFIRDVTPTQSLALALVENIHREDLNPVERARAYAELYHRFGLSHDQIAEQMGEDRSTVVNYLRLLDLPDAVLDFIADGRMSPGHARAVLSLADSQARSDLARRIVKENWSVRQAEAHVQEKREQAGGRGSRGGARPVISDLERRLTEGLMLRVRIVESRRKNTGRVVIEYYSLDDFDRIMKQLGLPST